MNKISIGDRMKSYENAFNFYLPHRSYVAIRLDGKCFSKLTKKLKLERPFSTKFINWMTQTTKVLAKEIQGCMIGYTQSDEISFIMSSRQSLEAEPWFANRIQKIVSISASIATAEFNRCMWKENENFSANFDCRIFVLPDLIECYNYLLWRQQDCIKNSISATAYYKIGEKLGRAATQKLIHNLNSEQRKQILLKECNIKWEDISNEFKNGIFVIKELAEINVNDLIVMKKIWSVKPITIYMDMFKKIVEEYEI
jgi:tRNA(His) 5'-end guanylyltransferase